MVRDCTKPGKRSWVKGRVIKKIGRQLYIVETISGSVWKRHANQIILSLKEFKDTVASSVLTGPLQRLNISESISTNNNLIIATTLMCFRIMTYSKMQS